MTVREFMILGAVARANAAAGDVLRQQAEAAAEFAAAGLGRKRLPPAESEQPRD